MRKIIAAMDGLRPSLATREYSMDLAVKSKSLLVGVFLDDFDYNSYRVYDLLTENSGNITTAKSRLDKKDAKTRAAAVADFEKECKKKGIDYIIHRDRNVAIRELIRESIYADLLVIEKNETLTNHPEKSPTTFVRQLLSDVQCPVLIVPHHYHHFERLVLLYDGEPSSVFAIRMLDYTIPQLLGLRSQTVFVNPLKQKIRMPEDKLMKEFMDRHVPDTDYVVLQGEPESTILKRLKKEKATTLIVLGAYKRGKISRLIRPSLADTLLAKTNLPLFIAHNK
ncbi:MAG: universal stress protein [Chitinophagaceae bacterium]